MIHTSIFTLFSISLPLLGLAAPLSHNATLVRRADCKTTTPGRGNAPCICDKKVGLRLGDVRPGCAKNNKALVFKDPKSATDFSLQFVASAGTTAVQCDHIVELQFIANQIDNGDPAICAALVDAAGNPTAGFETFFQKINSPDNLLSVDATINNAKGVIVGGKNFGPSKTKRQANGVVNYLKLMETTTTKPSFRVAQEISDTLDTVVGVGNGFNSFSALWLASVDSFIKNLQTCQIPKLKTRDEMSLWRRLVSPFSSRALSCPLPPTTPTSPVANTTVSAKPSATSAVPPVKPSTALPASSTTLVRPLTTPVKPSTTPVKPSTAPLKPPTTSVKPPVVPVKPSTTPVVPVVKPVTPVPKPPVVPAKPVAPVVKPPPIVPAVKPVAPAAKPAVKPALKPIVKTAVKPIAKPAIKPKRMT